MIRVGVIRGGPSSEYDISLATGGNVLSHLRSDKMSGKYKAIDILIDKEGAWHVNGRPTNIEYLSNMVDVVFNALHGDFGEDGKVQQMLDQWHIPYTGSGAFASALSYNKVLAKQQFSQLGIKTPQYIVLDSSMVNNNDIDKFAHAQARAIWQKFGAPWVVKPQSSGSSFGVKICKSFPELVEAILVGFNENVNLLVEEMIDGKEATVGVIDNFRNKSNYTLPPVEIRIPKSKTFFDYDAKYNGISEEICPGNFTVKEKEELEYLASLIHNGLNLSHYSRSDFIIHSRRGIYALEVNTLPGLTNESLTPKALSAVGATMPEFLDHIISLAINKNE
ncbi:MAG: D-alanine--D-alanine ligase [Patescibacteria group bacterium]|nr:D-alanine--D-alanine ligase [Patescibacteria group bacterium]